MVHGGPDWGINVPVATVYGVDDMGELAARLGSIVNFDRRGNIIFMDDFQSSLSKWHTVLALGAGGEIAITNERAKNGATSCKVTTPDAVGAIAQLTHYFSFPVLSKIGIEASFTLGPVEIDHICMALTLEDDVEVKLAQIKLIRAPPGSTLHTLQYLDADDNWVTFGTAHIYSANHYFVPAKLVADMENDCYVRFLIANYSFDLSAYPLRVFSPPPTPAHAAFSIVVENGAAGNHSLYLDDAIITQNEP